jgi:uncharacterized protein YecT (DUF1311 family)
MAADGGHRSFLRHPGVMRCRLLILVALAGCSGATSSALTSTTQTTGRTCDGATLEMLECLASIRDDLDATRADLLQQLIVTPPPLGGGEGDPPSMVDAWQAADEAFEAYRDAACGAAYLVEAGGTIRGPIGLGCEINLTEQHVEFLRTELASEGGS